MEKKVDLDLNGKVQKCLMEAIELADLNGRLAATRDIAVRVYDEEPELMKAISREWMIDRLVWTLSRLRRTRWDAKNAWVQLRLPEFPEEPKSVFLSDGRRKRFEGCTATDVENHIRALKQRFSSGPRIAQMEAILKVMRAYPERGITWLAVKKLELARREKG
jgi:hypothetical protein